MRRRTTLAPATPPSNKTQSTGSCAPARGRGPPPAQAAVNAAPHHTAGCGPRPGPALAADLPAAAAPHDTSPANNNRTKARRTSCRQQQAPPLRDAAKMSPRISITPFRTPRPRSRARPALRAAPIPEFFPDDGYVDLPLTLLGAPVSIGADPGSRVSRGKTPGPRLVGPPSRDRTTCARSA